MTILFNSQKNYLAHLPNYFYHILHACTYLSSINTKNYLTVIRVHFTNSNSIFRQFSKTLIPFGKTLYNLAKPYFLAKVRGFAKLYPIFPNRYIHSPIPKRKKEEPTSHASEPLYAQNPLISSHFPILSPNRTEIPMASIIDSRLCRCYTLMTFTPLYPIYPTQFDIRQIAHLPKNPYFSVRRNRIRAALKAVPVHALRPYLIWSVWYQTAKNGCSDRKITAFPHFQLPRMLPCRQTYIVLL